MIPPLGSHKRKFIISEQMKNPIKTYIIFINNRDMPWWIKANLVALPFSLAALLIFVLLKKLFHVL